MLKKIFIHIRKSLKLTILLAISTFLMLGGISYLYRPTYSVYINGEQVGYTENKSSLQKEISDYVENGENGEQNTAFVQVNEMPTYELCLLKKDIVTNDEEIINSIKSNGVTYYRYYAILEGSEEKAFVSEFSEAEEIIKELKEQESENIDDIVIVEKYETEIREFEKVATVIEELYVEKPEPVVELPVVKPTTVSISTTTSSGVPNLGITLIKPVTGTITSKFGVYSSIRTSSHTGLDIAATTGTKIVAAAAGTVTYAGYNGSYGNMIIIGHGNGVQTYYAHCNSLYVSYGQQVSQGQSIAGVGSTGNSSGPHLHLEVRVNGIAYNPQNYVY